MIMHHYTKSQLAARTVPKLRVLAKKLKITLPTSYVRKDDLIKMILKKTKKKKNKKMKLSPLDQEWFAIQSLLRQENLAKMNRAPTRLTVPPAPLPPRINRQRTRARLKAPQNNTYPPRITPPQNNTYPPRITPPLPPNLRLSPL